VNPIEIIKRRIELKRQLIQLTEKQIKELEAQQAMAEVEADEKPCRTWALQGGAG